MTASRLDILARLDAIAPWFEWPDVLDSMDEAGLVVDIPDFDATDVPQPTENDTPRWTVADVPNGELCCVLDRGTLAMHVYKPWSAQEICDALNDVRDHAAVTQELRAIRRQLTAARKSAKHIRELRRMHHNVNPTIARLLALLEDDAARAALGETP